MNHLMIKHKLWLSLILFCVILTALARQFSGAMTDMEKAFSALLDNQVEFAHTVDEVDMLMLKCRSNENDFLSTQNTSHVQEHAENLGAMQQSLAKLKQISKNQVMTDKLDKGISAVNTYGETFKVITEAWKEKGLTPEEGLRGQMRNAAHEIEDEFSDFTRKTMTVHLLMLRRHEKDFIIRNDEKYRTLWNQRHETMKSDLAGANLADDRKDKIREKLAAYAEKFNQFADTDKNITTNVAAMRDAINILEPILVEIRSEVNAMVNQTRQQTLIEKEARITRVYMEVGIFMVIGVILGLIFIRGISNRINLVIGKIKEFGSGRLHMDPVPDSGDEVGQVAQTLKVVTDAIRESLQVDEVNWTELANRGKSQSTQIEADRLAADRLRGKAADLEEVVQKASSGNLTTRATVHEDNDEVDRIAASLNNLLDKLNTDLTDIRGQADFISQSSVTLAEANAGIFERSNTASHHIESADTKVREVDDNIAHINGSITQLVNCLGDIATNAQTATEIANTAVSEAKEAGAIIAELKSHGEAISLTTGRISKIAQQTNLLALNATIEAERAGEAGKGFRVVAAEVKELAKETGNATEDVSSKVKAIQSTVDRAVQTITTISKIVDRINSTQQTIAASVEEQSSTSNKMESNTANAAEQSRQITKEMNQVLKAGEQTRDQLTESEQTVSMLNQLAVDLSTLLEKFALKS